MTNTRRSHLARTVLGIALACLGALPAAAQARTYPVNTCGATGAGGSSAGWARAYTGGASSTSMALVSGCSGPKIYGIVAASSANRQTVPSGAQGYYGLTAPPGTTITHVAWSGDVKTAGASGWRAGVWWAGASTKRYCAPSTSACHQTGNGAGVATNTSRVAVFAQCAAAGGCQTASTAPGSDHGHAARAELDAMTLTISDPTPPTISVSGAFWTSAWQGGSRALSFRATDASGISRVTLVIDGTPSKNYPLPPGSCSYNRPAPCPTTLTSPPGGWNIDTRTIADGPHTAYVITYDAALNPRSTAPITIHVDNTRPGKPVAFGLTNAGGSAWTNVDSYTSSWSDPPQGANQAPIAAAAWCIAPSTAPPPPAAPSNADRENPCPDAVSAGWAATPTATGLLRAPREGRWHLYVMLVDAAGNTSPLSDPALLRYDATPPAPGSFEPQDPGDPTALDVQVADNASGVVGGQVELARQGSHTWHQLPTTVDGDLLRARVDDSTLPKGTYALRATAVDAAGNVSVGSRRTSGQAASIAIPIRIATRARAGFVRVRYIRRHGHRVRVSALQHTRTVPYKHQVRIDGRLTTGDGQALAGRRLTITARPATNTSRPEVVGYVTTDKDGKYTYRGVARLSRTLRFAFAGNAVLLPSARSVKLRVPASSTIHEAPKVVLNGSYATFTGRLRGGHIPRRGVQVALEYDFQGDWRLVGHRIWTDRAGRWSIRYPFYTQQGRKPLAFRLSVLGSPDYPFAPGHSRPVHVTVQGS